MVYKIPKEEEIRKAIYRAMRKYGGFSSLGRLRKGILEELKKMNKEYTISMKRSRILTARSGFVKLEIKKGHSKRKIEKCPVCGEKLIEIKNLNLIGKEVVIGYKCPLCNYRGKIYEMPTRYSFHFTK